jgi:phosphoribosylformimino-5-aminoimidazole carboxamide ribotide isomerase
MDILPAIDLKDGQAVRLTKGLMKSAKVYANSPWEVAKEFEKMGSRWLHLVDLNGAFAGEPKNIKEIKKIRESTDISIELGGGIRGEDSIKRYLDIGIDRIILGSVALKDADFVKRVAKKYPIAVGIDAVDGYVAVEGWSSKSSIKATDLAKRFADVGVEVIICTDVGQDGTLSGVNVEFTLEIARASGIDTIASGGVRDLEDIKKLKDTNSVSGVIVGKAYYEGTLDLKDALKFVES